MAAGSSNSAAGVITQLSEASTVLHKILAGENIDKFPAIRQYFPFQNFPFS